MERERMVPIGEPELCIFRILNAHCSTWNDELNQRVRNCQIRLLVTVSYTEQVGQCQEPKQNRWLSEYDQ
eukprot:325174-Karenia_brevis.AAC.1